MKFPDKDFRTDDVSTTAISFQGLDANAMHGADETHHRSRRMQFLNSEWREAGRQNESYCIPTRRTRGQRSSASVHPCCFTFDHRMRSAATSSTSSATAS